MKTYLLFIFSLISLIIIACDIDKESNGQPGLKGQLISKSACKNDFKSAGLADNQSCVEYSYDPSAHKLTLNHINAGFNCCPGNLYCNITVNKDTLVIREIEEKSDCNCDCIYDLNIAIQSVEEKTYKIKFIEPYIGDQEKIEFHIDLSKNKTGSFCVNRDQYPWNIK